MSPDTNNDEPRTIPILTTAIQIFFDLNHRTDTISVLQTVKLNDVTPEAYPTDTLSRIAAGHPINRISEPMP